jgi:hypothetical protein
VHQGMLCVCALTGVCFCDVRTSLPLLHCRYTVAQLEEPLNHVLAIFPEAQVGGSWVDAWMGKHYLTVNGQQVLCCLTLPQHTCSPGLVRLQDGPCLQHCQMQPLAVLQGPLITRAAPALLHPLNVQSYVDQALARVSARRIAKVRCLGPIVMLDVSERSVSWVAQAMYEWGSDLCS